MGESDNLKYVDIAKTIELLEATKELLSDPYVWTQGAFCTADGRMCVLGALNYCSALQPYYLYLQALNALNAALGKPDSVRGILVDWNDAENRCQDEVLSLFVKAIDAIASGPV